MRKPSRGRDERSCTRRRRDMRPADVFPTYHRRRKDEARKVRLGGSRNLCWEARQEKLPLHTLRAPLVRSRACGFGDRDAASVEV